MTEQTSQAIGAAIAFVVLVFIAVGVARILARRRGANEDAFGAGGTSTVGLGTVGMTKTALTPSGVVLAAGEQWTARSADRRQIGSGQRVRVVGQDGLTLIVDTVPADAPAGE